MEQWSVVFLGPRHARAAAKVSLELQVLDGQQAPYCLLPIQPGLEASRSTHGSRSEDSQAGCDHGCVGEPHCEILQVQDGYIGRVTVSITMKEMRTLGSDKSAERTGCS